VLAGVGDGEADLSRKLLDRAISVAQHIDNLDSTSAGEGLSDPSELVEELHFYRAIRHQPELSLLSDLLSSIQLSS